MMVTQYQSQRQKVYTKVIPILKSKVLDIDKKFFISSMSLDLAVKPALIEEVIQLLKDTDVIREEQGMLKSVRSKEDMLKSEAEIEVDEEFKKMGL